jgi:hypothetical protein
MPSKIVPPAVLAKAETVSHRAWGKREAFFALDLRQLAQEIEVAQHRSMKGNLTSHSPPKIADRQHPAGLPSG